MRPPTGIPVPPVPIQEAVSEFINALVGLGTAASKVTPATVERDGGHLIALYKDEHGNVAAIITADLAMASSTGAALAMIPATAAKEVVADGAMTETLFDNYREVANILAAMLNTPRSPHLSLIDVWSSDDTELPDQAWTILGAPTKRREFAVTIDGYGSGKLGVVIR